ncbi:MAG: arsenic resistance N-acetyltransferase ArsN2 [Proteobacteria bacterium]|nr:arsenic resistance N-acetyltransferase ArsN2 [Pseudomonadota bacterium]
MTEPLEIRRAVPAELPQVDALLEAEGLPPVPSRLPLANLLVGHDGGEVVGAIGLEVCALHGLVRSLVVAPSHARSGLGSSLLESLVARAHELSLRDLYLLTENADDFFAKLGFETVERAGVPSGIRSTREFREQCPESATVMRRPLASRF